MRWSSVSALLLQYFFITYKTLDRIADLFFWPFMSVLLWGFVTVFLQSGYDVDIVGLILAGFVFYQFFQRAQTDIPLFLLEEFWHDNLQNVFSTPVSEWDKLVSMVIYSVIKAIIPFFITVGLAFVFFKYNLFSLPPLYLASYFFSLSLFSIGLGIFVSGLIFRYGTNVQMIAWGIPFFLQPLMAVYYPVSILPSFLQSLARFIPASYVFEGLRNISQSGVFDWNNFLLSVFMSIVLIVFSCWFYSLCFKYNKKMGKLIHAE